MSFTPLRPRLTKLFRKLDQNGSASSWADAEADDLAPAVGVRPLRRLSRRPGMLVVKTEPLPDNAPTDQSHLNQRICAHLNPIPGPINAPINPKLTKAL